MSYEYKCVPGPTVVSVRKAKERDLGVKAYEDIMNREAADGWEFVAIDEFHTSEPESWLSRKRVYISSKMLVFRRQKAAPVPVVLPEPALKPTPIEVAPPSKKDKIVPAKNAEKSAAETADPADGI